MYIDDTYTKNKDYKLNFESYLRSSFPSLTETNIKYLKTKTEEISNIYNAIFKNICIYYSNRNDEFILMKIKEDIKEKQKNYLKDFCIGDSPMYLPPIQTLTNCIKYIPKIIYSIKTNQSNPIENIRKIIPNNLINHNAQFMMGVIYSSIKTILYYERKTYDIDYTLLNGYNVYNYYTQTLSIAQHFKSINLILPDSKFESESETNKIITIGILVGYISVKKSYELQPKTEDQIIESITCITEKLIKKLLPQKLNQTGNCIEPMFSDENLKDLFNKIKKIKKTKLAIMCSNFNSNNVFDILSLLQDDITKSTNITNSKNSVLCIEWSRDRKLFREVLVEMIISNSFFDIMKNSIELLSANILNQEQYINFNQSLIDYKKMKKT